MYYTIYKVTNLINGKIYIGSHKTKDLNDGYMGSGKYLKLAQEKYGISNFTKEILFVFDTPEAMYKKESEIVNEDFLVEENTYNLKVGGFGGFDYVNSILTSDQRTIISNNSKRFSGKTHTVETKCLMSLSKSKELNPMYGKPSAFKNKQHSEKTKKEIGEKNSIHQSGSGNSQYGTKWIYSEKEKISKRIKKEDSLPEGWKEGRKIKF